MHHDDFQIREREAGIDRLDGRVVPIGDLAKVDVRQQRTCQVKLSRGNAIEVDRVNRLHPTAEPRRSYVHECLGASGAPVIAASDYVRSVSEQIRPWVAGPYSTLGTDGFGRSDYRRVLRRFFEVDRHHITLAAVHALDRPQDAERAIVAYRIDPEARPPWTI